jgi:hypothetical protein
MLARLNLRRMFAPVGLVIFGAVAAVDAQEPSAPAGQGQTAQTPFSPRITFPFGQQAPRPEGNFNEMLQLTTERAASLTPQVTAPRCMRSVPVSPNADRQFLQPVSPNSGTIRRQILPPCVPIAASVSEHRTPEPRTPEPN